MIVLRRFRETASVGAEVTSGGELFQRRLPATGNAVLSLCRFVSAVFCAVTMIWLYAVAQGMGLQKLRTMVSVVRDPNLIFMDVY